MKSISHSTPLKNFTRIRSGLLFKNGIHPDHNGNTQVIQLKDVDSDGYLDSRLQRVRLAAKEADLLKDGNVLFKAKTNQPVAALFEKDKSPTVATAHYFIITVDEKIIHSGYLTWYLNQGPAQNYFEKNGGGTNIMVINKRVLEALPVPLPPLEVQGKIYSVWNLQRWETRLENTLQMMKARLVEARLMQKASV